ncbi:hypothetical protein BG004_007233 [Podila humilis]|nr:hypothetical protein BG004_007233 [Podila humilis]
MSSTEKPTPVTLPQERFRYRSSRWPGNLLFLTGVVHNIAGLTTNPYRDPFFAALRDGYYDQFEKDPARSNAFWFLFAGVFTNFTGLLLNWYLFPEERLLKGGDASDNERERPRRHQQISKYVLPRGVGYWILGLGVGGMLAFPTSGFYMAVLQGVALVVAE